MICKGVSIDEGVSERANKPNKYWYRHRSPLIIEPDLSNPIE
jgi:hypothetical protein